MASQRGKKSSPTPKALPSFISYLLIGSCVLLIPLAFSKQTIDPALSLRFTILSLSLILIVLLLVGAVLKRAVRLNTSIFGRVIFPVFLFYVIFSALSLFQAVNTQEGIFELLKICLSFLVFAIAVIVLRHSPNSIMHLTKAVIIASTVSAFIGICQYYGLAFNWIPGNFVIYGTMTNKNLFASFLFLMLPFPLYGFFYLKSSWDALSGLALLLSTGCIVLAASRAVWLAVLLSVVSVGIIGWYALKKFNVSKGDGRHILARSTILVGLFLASSILGYFSKSRHTQQPIREKVASAASLGGSSIQVRLKMWNKSLHMIADHPIFGIGLGNWKLIIPSYGTSELPSEHGRVQYLRPHNDFLWVGAETGLLGLISYLALFGIVIYYFLRSLKHSQDIKESIFLLALAFGVIGFLVISGFSFPKERITHLIFINIILAVILIKYHKQFDIRKKLTSVPIVPVVMVALLILVGSTFLGFDRIRSELHSKKAFGYWQKEQWKEMLKEAQAAPSNLVNMDAVGTPIPWYEGLANISMNKKKEALRGLIKAYQVHPYHIQVLDNLATCYELLGDHSNAIKYYNKVLEISPQFENSLRNLSVVYYKMGNYREAIQTYSQADLNSQNKTLFKHLEIYQNELEKNK